MDMLLEQLINGLTLFFLRSGCYWIFDGIRGHENNYFAHGDLFTLAVIWDIRSWSSARVG